jgi:hypothetical protein
MLILSHVDSPLRFLLLKVDSPKNEKLTDQLISGGGLEKAKLEFKPYIAESPAPDGICVQALQHCGNQILCN